YNLRVIAGGNDSLLTIAYRFLGERDKAWMLDGYNHRRGEPVRRGDVVLVPLSDLALTAEGRAEAASAGALVRTDGAGKGRGADAPGGRRASPARRRGARWPLGRGHRAGQPDAGLRRALAARGRGHLARPHRGVRRPRRHRPRRDRVHRLARGGPIGRA